MQAFGLWTAGEPVVLGISGGADSTALLSACLLLPWDLRPRIIAAHLDHGIRGPAAAGDLQAARRLAAQLGVPFEACRRDVPAHVRRSGLSTEAAARSARYGFLAEVAARHGAVAVAVGHHGDDQAETVLLRLLRGAGSRGLAGMRPLRTLTGPADFRGRLVRPLWFACRAEVLAHLAAAGLSWVEDESNIDLGPLRNRVRHRVLPALEAAAGPGIRLTLARAARNLAEDDQALAAWTAAEARRRIVDGCLSLAGGWSDLPAAIRHRLVQAWWEAATGLPPLPRATSEVLQALPEGALADLPGGRRAVREPAGLRLAGRAAADPVEPLVLPVPGRLALPSGVLSAACRPWPDPVLGAETAGRSEAVVGDASGLVWPLVVRPPLAGERVAVRGVPGPRAVRELLRAAGVPAVARTAPRVVTDATGRVLWVAGIRAAAAFAVHPATSAVLHLALAGPGGTASLS